MIKFYSHLKKKYIDVPIVKHEQEYALQKNKAEDIQWNTFRNKVEEILKDFKIIPLKSLKEQTNDLIKLADIVIQSVIKYISDFNIDENIEKFKNLSKDLQKDDLTTEVKTINDLISNFKEYKKCCLKEMNTRQQKIEKSIEEYNKFKDIDDITTINKYSNFLGLLINELDIWELFAMDNKTEFLIEQIQNLESKKEELNQKIKILKN